MREVRLEIEAKWQKRMEREKDRVSEKLLDSMDKEGRAEMVDNGWLKREVRTLTGLSLVANTSSKTLPQIYSFLMPKPI